MQPIRIRTVVRYDIHNYTIGKNNKYKRYGTLVSAAAYQFDLHTLSVRQLCFRTGLLFFMLAFFRYSDYDTGITHIKEYEYGL